MYWDSKDVCEGFESYRDYPEELFGYRWIMGEIARQGADAGRELVILDYGCGPGKCSLRLAEQGAGRVIAVDQSERMLNMARQLRSHPKIDYRLIRDDVVDLPEGSIDVAIACFVFINTESIPRIQRAMQNVRRALKPSGLFYILDTNPGTTGRRFSTFVSGEPDRAYGAGESRIVRLFRGDQECLCLKDYHWPKQIYVDNLKQAGFSRIDVFEPTLADIPQAERSAFAEAYGFAGWRDEATHPPFILLRATVRGPGA